MSRYSLQLRVRPSLYYGSLLEGSPNLAQALEQALLGAVIGELRPVSVATCSGPGVDALTGPTSGSVVG